IYHCKNCLHSFSVKDEHSFVHKPDIILVAVCYYNQNYSLSETKQHLKNKLKTNISTSTISRWNQNFPAPYQEIKQAITEKQGKDLIQSTIFNHYGLNYNYKLHLGKLNLFAPKQTKEYLLNLDKNIKPIYFKDQRSSQSKLDLNISLFHQQNLPINDLVKESLKLATNNRQRHQIVESYFLSCDRNTLATEVPVWYYDKQSETTISGHIDILQYNFKKIYILDYKPNAAQENTKKVAFQLYHYAKAFSFRTKIPLKQIRCAWFDEVDLFSFDPSAVILGTIIDCQ
ncbi:MAG: hypothetical protein ABIA37_01825, partial [Candidatus Woesearchaeota archaeon]